jgi:hypothetical protein
MNKSMQNVLSEAADLWTEIVFKLEVATIIVLLVVLLLAFFASQLTKGLI